MNKFKSILEPTTATVIEKKSKFIANLFHVSSKEEAEMKIKEQQKMYHDARHNCFAYIIHEKDNILERASDDGEPSRNSRSSYVEFAKKI